MLVWPIKLKLKKSVIPYSKYKFITLFIF